MDQYENLFLKIENLKCMGNFEEALKILLYMKQKTNAGKNKIQAEILKVKFLLGLYEEVLEEALSYVQDDEEIWKWLLKEYCEPFQDEHHKMFEKNQEYLKQYPYFFGDVNALEHKILWFDEGGKLISVNENRVSVYDDNLNLQECTKLLLFCNLINIDLLLQYQKKTQYEGVLPYYKEPIYLYYDQDVFDALLQCIDFELLLADNRIVLFKGEEVLENFFYDLQAVIPDDVVGYGKEKVIDILNRVFDKNDQDYIDNLKQIENYYENAEGEIKERIHEKKPRILFISSYFTTVMQYHIKDCMRSAEKLGLKTELLIEKGAIYRVNEYNHISKVTAFHPDVIFCIDHFRFEYNYPKPIVWISWLQDLLLTVIDTNTPERLGSRDIILNHFTTWNEFKKIGYSSANVIDAPIPASSDIYKVYKLSNEEYQKYHCDICFVCHASDVETHIKNLIKDLRLTEEAAAIIYDIYYGYQQFIYETGTFFGKKQLFIEFIEGVLSRCFNRRAKPEVLELIASDMFQNFNQRAYRQALVDWILDAGFTNLKLWGNGWKENEKYQAYAMGAAKNGEVLSKIYQSAKIVVGNNVMTTSAARAWETMLSGGFYLSNYIPEEDDITDIRKIVEVDKDVIMFYNKQDLIDKIHYYLEHEEERREMIRRGRKVALEKMTYDIFMERTISEVANRF